MYTIIDLSNNNGPVDWRRLKKSGVSAAWLKATEGVTFDDNTYAVRKRNANYAGLFTGAYHFAHPEHNTAREEAHHFCKVVRKLDKHDLKPVLDFESGTPHPSYFSWIVEFNHYVKEALGRYPVFYSYPSYITGLRLSRPVGNGLWLASYGRNDGKDHGATTPPPWKKWQAHQFTSQGTVGGVSFKVDLSHAPSLWALLAHPLQAKWAHLF